MPTTPADVLSAMTKRDNAAYMEQSRLAIALRKEGRGESGARYYRDLSEESRIEKEDLNKEVLSLFMSWMNRVEPAHAL